MSMPTRLPPAVPAPMTSSSPSGTLMVPSAARSTITALSTATRPSRSACRSVLSAWYALLSSSKVMAMML
jgi:hypothetical protein